MRVPYLSDRKWIVCGVVWDGVYMCLYSCCPTCCTLSIWAGFPSDAELQNINWMCTYRSHWNENSQSDFVNCTPSNTVSCFFINNIVVDCGTPRSLSNGQRRYSSTTFGSTVTYTCNTGYLRTAGSSSRTCQSNGQWSGSHPTCSRKSTLCHYIIHCILTTIKHAKELVCTMILTLLWMWVHQRTHCQLLPWRGIRALWTCFHNVSV